LTIVGPKVSRAPRRGIEGVTGAALVAVTWRGYARVQDVLADARCQELLGSCPNWQPMARIVGRVHQSGSFCQFLPNDCPSSLRWLVDELSSQISRVAPRLQLRPFNEFTFQRYRVRTDYVGAHRDQARYRGLIAAFTLTGSSSFSIMADDRETILDSWSTAPGDLVLLRASKGPGNGLSVIHKVDAPPEGIRVSLTLRHNALVRT